VTHQIQFIKKATKILVLKDGRPLAFGSYAELIDSGIDFMSLISEEKKENEKKKEEAKSEELLIAEQIITRKRTISTLSTKSDVNLKQIINFLTLSILIINNSNHRLTLK